MNVTELISTIRRHQIIFSENTEGSATDDSVLYIPLDNDAVNDVIWQGNKEI